MREKPDVGGNRRTVGQRGSLDLVYVGTSSSYCTNFRNSVSLFVEPLVA